MFTKDEVFQYWKNFLSRSNHYDVSILINKINEAFCEHYQEIVVPTHQNKRTFMLSASSYFFYFDHIIEKIDKSAIYSYHQNKQIHAKIRHANLKIICIIVILLTCSGIQGIILFYPLIIFI